MSYIRNLTKQAFFFIT